ncbi:MAG: BcpO-related WXXGXW repeat protein, partial [Candidatus Aminicenantes bacterium]|nr:BcpO-related WXXGXW repeat protein [Candidatus Aminicenantes bacterium]NIM78002.1 BcpO-related WXXGXW repeat protein [Candidatus Aminicenantes bacterium]NIN17324.1 BcpO-related WXXGXW repeat protein [Candidatus Aminicenantes bacterium]NIN41216.1 BcpO-related WXXGXW repeat protein [Candidatus Aminicenantes bacterium]NIN83990.1 BcpO-related WXXGXW repeat protein [Candidatus Aminicenantes bacterium]
MKLLKKLFGFVLVLVFSFSLMNCAPPRPVREPPPRPRREARPPKPGPNYIWVSGHHVWRHGRWVWVSGHWVKKRPGMVWVQGHWEKRGGR